MNKILIIIGLLFCCECIFANCTWQWDCSSGSCEHVSLCDSSMELPSLEPLSLPPLATPTIKPISGVGMAPLGTTNCDKRYICASTGNCSWQQVCQ